MSAITLTQADNGKTVEVAQGGTVTLQLAENPTTGFRWAIEGAAGPAVTLADDDYTSTSGGAAGGGGTRTFVLRAAQPGTATIRLKLWREWEGEASVRERFEATVQVR